MLETPTPMVVHVLDDILFETSFTKKIHSLKLAEDMALMTFTDSRVKISQEYCQQQINK